MYQSKAGGDQNTDERGSKTKFGIKRLSFLQCATRREVLQGNLYCIISMLYFCFQLAHVAADSGHSGSNDLNNKMSFVSGEDGNQLE